MKSLAWFVGVASLHFVLSVAGSVLALRAAFDAQGGLWAAPVAITLAHLSEILLAPLPLVRDVLPDAWRGGYAEIALVSALFGAVAVGLLRLRRAAPPRQSR